MRWSKNVFTYFYEQMEEALADILWFTVRFGVASKASGEGRRPLSCRYFGEVRQNKNAFTYFCKQAKERNGVKRYPVGCIVNRGVAECHRWGEWNDSIANKEGHAIYSAPVNLLL